MSKNNKRRLRKRQKYLKKLARRNTQLLTLYSKESEKELIPEEILQKTAKVYPEPFDVAQGKLNRGISQTIEENKKESPKIQKKTQYLKQDLIKVMVISLVFIISFIIIYLADKKNGFLLSIINKF